VDRADWDRRYAEKPLLWSAGPNQFVAAELGDLAPGAALDLGAGEGRNAIWLAGRGWRVSAVDFSRVALERARRLAARRGVEVAWVLEDLSRYRPRPGAYDLVLMCYLQLPEAERRRVIAAARAALVPGGTFLYVGHDASNLTRGVGGPQDPAVLCSPGEVVAELPGWRVVRAEVVTRRVQGESGHGGKEGGVALDALVRAVRPR